MAKHAQNKELMLFCQQCDIALSLTLAAPISKCFRRPWSNVARISNAANNYNKQLQAISRQRPLTNFMSEIFLCQTDCNYELNANLGLIHWQYCYFNLHSVEFVIFVENIIHCIRWWWDVAGILPNYRKYMSWLHERHQNGKHMNYNEDLHCILKVGQPHADHFGF